MIHTFSKSVTTHGTPVTLTSTRTAASWLIVYARHGNAGAVFVGDSTTCNEVDTGAGAYVGHRLTPGSTLTIPPVGTTTPYDLLRIYLDADNSADGVVVTYGRH